MHVSHPNSIKKSYLCTRMVLSHIHSHAMRLPVTFRIIAWIVEYGQNNKCNNVHSGYMILIIILCTKKCHSLHVILLLVVLVHILVPIPGNKLMILVQSIYVFIPSLPLFYRAVWSVWRTIARPVSSSSTRKEH